MLEDETKTGEETEAVLRGKVDLILESIASLDPTRITDPQLKRIRWPAWMIRVAVPAAALLAGSAAILLLVLLLVAR